MVLRLFPKRGSYHNDLLIEAVGIPAEEILLMRSPHYKQLIQYYDVRTADREKVLKRLKEEPVDLLLTYMDDEDRLAYERMERRKVKRDLAQIEKHEEVQPR